MSDYRINDLHIQAHVHGLSSRSVLDVDDSPTVLRGRRVLRNLGHPDEHNALPRPI
jgi:hypothetical protein